MANTRSLRFLPLAAFLAVFGVINSSAGELSPAAFSGVQANSLTVNWGTTFSTGTVYYVRLSSVPGYAASIASSSTLNDYQAFSGLAVNTTYYGYVSTTSGSGYVLVGGGSTLAVPPASGAFAGVYYSSAALSWSTATNPAWTTYQYQVSASSSFGVIASSGSGGGSVGWVTGLSEGTTYYGRVRALNNDDVPTAYVYTSSAVTSSQADSAAPTVAILQPQDGSYLSALAAITGTAEDDVAVASAAITIRKLSDSYYWNSSDWQAGQVWLTTGVAGSSWTYGGVPAWVNGSSYTVVAKAADSSGNWSVVYATSTFVYDIAAPTAVVIMPAAGEISTFTYLAGTAADAVGLAQVEVSVRRWSDDNFWGGSSWISTETWNLASGTTNWAYTGISSAALTEGATYTAYARAYDLAGNVSDFGLGLSTFTYYAANHPPEILSLTANPVFVSTGAASIISCTAYDVDEDALTYEWNCASGTIIGTGASVSWVSPDSTSTYMISVAVEDDAGGSDYDWVFVQVGTGVPLAGEITPLPLSGLSTGSLTVNWGTTFSTGTVYYVRLSSVPGYAASIASSSTLNDYQAFSGLAVNTTYYGYVSTTSGSGYVLVGGGSTLAVPPASGAFAGVYYSSAALSWSTETNPPWTVYQYQVSVSSSFGVIASSGSGGGSVGWLTGLSEGTTYYGRIRALNNDNVPTVYIYTSSAVTGMLPPPPDTTVPLVYLSQPQNGASLPALAQVSGTASDNTAVTMVQLVVRRITDGYYWSGSDFGSGQVWLTADYAVSSWTYNSASVTWVHGSSYAVTAMAYDAAGNHSSASSTFTYVVDPATGIVSGITGTVMGSTSVQWTWNSGSIVEAFGYGVFTAGDVFISSVAFSIGSASYTQTGLPVNAPAAVKVGAYTSGGYGTLTQSASYYTHAAVPGAISVTARSSASVSVAWSDGGNPAGTVYWLARDISAGFGAPEISTGTVVSSTASNLSAATTYYFKVRALNGDGVGSSYSAAVSTITLPALAAAPQAPAGMALGVSSISWTWNAVASASGYKVYLATGGQIGSPSAPAYEQEGLQPNTTYSIKASALNDTGEGALSVAGTPVATLANVPLSPSTSAVYATSATITWGLNGNPAGTTAKMLRRLTGAGAGATFTTADTSYTDTGLLGCTTYDFLINNVNRDGVNTAYASLLSVLTASPVPLPPGNFMAQPLSNYRISLTWEPAPYEGITGYNLYYDNATSTISYVSPLATFTAGQTSYIADMPGPGNYKFGLRAVHRCGTEEPNTRIVAMAPALFSLTGVKAAIKIPQSGKKINGNSVTVMAELVLGSAADTRDISFQYKLSTAPEAAWAAIPPKNASTHPNPDPASPYFILWNVDGLAQTSYDLRAVATDKGGIADAAPSAITVNITDQGNADIKENASGNTVTKEQEVSSLVSNTIQTGAGDSQQMTTLVIPATALETATAAVSVTNNPLVTLIAPANAQPSGVITRISLSNGQKHLANGKTADVTLVYSDADNDGIVDGSTLLASQLVMYSADDPGGPWTSDLSSVVDMATNKVHGRTSHFSYFALFGPIAANLNSAKVYPVPWKPGSGGRFDTPAGVAEGLIFDDLPASAEIRIYTITGQLVRKLDVTAADGGYKVWDGKNSSGLKAASGVYLAHIKSGSGKKILKLAVER